jgi:hypothetical protein
VSNSKLGWAKLDAAPEAFRFEIRSGRFLMGRGRSLGSVGTGRCGKSAPSLQLRRRSQKSHATNDPGPNVALDGQEMRSQNPDRETVPVSGGERPQALPNARRGTRIGRTKGARHVPADIAELRLLASISVRTLSTLSVRTSAGVRGACKRRAKSAKLCWLC